MLLVGIHNLHTQECMLERSVLSKGDAVDFFVRYHSNVQLDTQIIISCSGTLILATDESPSLRATIGRAANGMYTTYWQPIVFTTNGSVRYDFESSVTWVCMVCDFFLRLLNPPPRLIRTVVEYNTPNTLSAWSRSEDVPSTPLVADSCGDIDLLERYDWPLSENFIHDRINNSSYMH